MSTHDAWKGYKFFTFQDGEIQDGRQKIVGKRFLGKLPVVSVDTLGVKNFNEITLSRTISKIYPFYHEIPDGRQKWQEIDFWEKSPVDPADTLWDKNFYKITLSHIV